MLKKPSALDLDSSKNQLLNEVIFYVALISIPGLIFSIARVFVIG
jgi:hypothetical protein